MTDKKATERLKLIIPLATYRKIMAYTTLCDLEISGFCELEYSESRNAFIAGEVYLLKQEVSGAATHMDEETVSAFNLERIKAGANQLPRLWFHSHVNMAAFFSTIDEDTLKDLQNDTFTVALVVNKQKEMKAKAYIYSETTSRIMGIELESKEQVEVDPLPVSIEFDYERIPEALRKEVDEKVTKRVYTPALPYSTHQPHGGKKRKHGHASIIKPLFLPKDRVAAARKVEDKGLVGAWDSIREEFIYEDPYTGEVYIDYWEALEGHMLPGIEPEEPDFGGGN